MTEQTASAPDKVTFESALEQLQGVIKQLESGELSLDQALEYFEKGVRLTRSCQEQLAGAEQRVELLMKAGANGGVETKPFPNSPTSR